MTRLFDSLSFPHGPAMKNRFMLAPLTNTQSHSDGCLSAVEKNWLVMRAKGGFGATMTCAAHVQAIGQGFEGQLGNFSDRHLEGLSALAKEIASESSLSLVQLHHAGMRSPSDLIGTKPLCPSENEKTGAREMTGQEVSVLISDFIAAALRAKEAGMSGVQIHGAHGYILGQFLSSEINQRSDQYGGSLENRSRIVFEILDGMREKCGPDFHIGLRLSPERFGQKLSECLEVAQRAMDTGKLDHLDMSLWDVDKEPNEAPFAGRKLRSYFLDLNRGETRLGLAGKLNSATISEECLKEGYDFVSIGRGAILHHDFPKRVREDADFSSTPLPVSRDYLRAEGLGEAFIEYMARWDGFVLQGE